MVIIKCDRCGGQVSGRDEHEAEVKWSAHRCQGMRSLDDLPMDLLRKVAFGDMTEEQAWAEANAKTN